MLLKINHLFTAIDQISLHTFNQTNFRIEGVTCQLGEMLHIGGLWGW